MTTSSPAQMDIFSTQTDILYSNLKCIEVSFDRVLVPGLVTHKEMNAIFEDEFDISILDRAYKLREDSKIKLI